MKSNSSLLILALSGLPLALPARGARADAPAPVTVAPAAKPAQASAPAPAETDAALFNDKAEGAAPRHKAAPATAKLTPRAKVGLGATTLVASGSVEPSVKIDVALRVTAPPAPLAIKTTAPVAAKNAKMATGAKAGSTGKKPARAALVSLSKSDAPKTAVKSAPESSPAKPVANDAANSIADRTHPEILASRHKDEEMLAQLDADLDRSQQNLDKAGADLSEGQKQLASFTDVLNQAMLEAGPDAKGLNPFVKVAQRYAGTPYVWGGESRTGFDCSGFIIIVMRDLGYKALPHSAAEQFHYGMPIAQALLKPGDLVFFANTYKPGISHVGIYLGHRRFIHAAGTGIGTIVSSLDNPHFQAKYAGARRLVQSER